MKCTFLFDSHLLTALHSHTILDSKASWKTIKHTLVSSKLFMLVNDLYALGFEMIIQYSGTPRLRPPLKSEWGGLKRGMVSREGFATLNTRGCLQRLTSTLGGA